MIGPIIILKKHKPFSDVRPKRELETKNDPIEKILYNKIKKSLEIYPIKKSERKKDFVGTPIGDWIFHPQEGFYLIKERKSYEKKESILSHHIDEQLEKNAPFFQKHLTNASLEIKPIAPRYLIRFDESWNLSVELYLFEPKDLLHPHSVFFWEMDFYPRQRILSSTRDSL